MAFKVKYSKIFCIFAIILIVALRHTLSAQADNNVRPFDVRLYSELVKAAPEENIIYSPFFTKTSLFMTRMVAEGETAREMDQNLGLSGQKLNDVANYYNDILKKYHSDSIFRIASKIYIMRGYEVKKKIKNLLAQQSFGSIGTLNFTRNKASAQAINTWVAEKTDNAITNVVTKKELSKDSRLVLVNAVHFKDDWIYGFNEKNTHTANFYLNGQPTFNVSLMAVSGHFNYTHLTDLNADVLDMPFFNFKLSMLIILPRSYTGLPDMEKKLENIPLSNITSRMELTYVRVHLPRFTIEFNAELSKSLSNIGLKHIFSPDADINKMLKSPKELKLNSIIHKTVIEIDEEGMVNTNGVVPPFFVKSSSYDATFVANRPFYFTIKYENTKIFEGRINSKF